MSRSLLVVILTAVLLLELGNWVPKVSSTRISIADNGYSNIVVAIHPDVPETDAQAIIDNIQKMIRQASSVLYRATKQRAYYKDVRILIPSSWVNIPADECTWETYSTADVQVAPPGSHGDKPYTLQTGGCGQPGEYIHLTPNYLRNIGQPDNTADYGPAEKVFVYEWSRLRYGVFEEFGEKGNNQYPLFYKPDSSLSPIPNLCTDKPPSFTTQNPNTGRACKLNNFGEYPSNCVYILDPDFSPASSLMSLYSVNSVVEFCEDGTHNKMAKTKYNAMCGSKAVWTIISDHPDFKNDNNPPKDVENLEPSFKIVRCSSSRFVLVMDTSGSMDDYNRITRLHDSAMRWIKYDISDGSQLGLVKFSTSGTILSNLVLINDQKSRDSLIARLPTVTSGSTCIGCGLLLEALKILRPTEDPVPKFNSTNDYYPPSRVIDLLVVQANNLEMNKSITIQFTAPGDELDWGTAFKYEIRYSTEFDDLLPDHFNLVGNSILVQPEHIINGSLQPSPSGSKELIAFTVNTDSLMNTTYFIAARAIDRVGQIGGASNIASALFPSQQQCQSSWK